MENFLILFGGLLLLSVLFGKISDKYGIPALLIFLSVGMLAGSDGVLGIAFDNKQITQNIGTVALIFILFSGGLDTVLKSIKPVLIDGFILATLGVFITAFVVAAALNFIYGYPLIGTLLVGAVIASTDAAAVFAILRSSGIKLKERINSLLELESGSNDPMAIFLTISVIELISTKNSFSFAAWLYDLIFQFGIGTIFGIAFGLMLPVFLNKLRLGYWGLYPVFSIGFVLMLYAVTVKCGGNGFISVYVAGIFANTKDFVHKKNLIGFHDGIAWMMQVVIFVTLGLLVNPSELPNVAFQGFVVALILMFIARPISVFVCLALSKYNFKEKLFISWVGLRGVVPIILATYPFVAGIENSQMMFNIVFFMVLFSVLVQGMSLAKVAKILGVQSDEAKTDIQHASPIFSSQFKKLTISQGSQVIGKSLAELELDEKFLIVLVNRLGEISKPTGAFEFKEKDLLIVLCDDDELYRKTISQKF